MVTKFRDAGSVCDRKHVCRFTMLTCDKLHNVEGTVKKQFVFFAILLSPKLTNTAVVEVAS
jgi:hypothetical protein